MTDAELNKRLRDYPFLRYAVRYWADLARGYENELREHIEKFLTAQLKLSSMV
jgi:hypothetical protein